MDAVFLQKELDDGLTIQDVQALMSMIHPSNQVMPISTSENNSAADGFITMEGLDKIEGREETLLSFVRDIIGDMAKENPDGLYETPEGLKIFIGYEVPEPAGPMYISGTWDDMSMFTVVNFLNRVKSVYGPREVHFYDAESEQHSHVGVIASLKKMSDNEVERWFEQQVANDH